jgi:hypothetical protein
VASVDKRKLSNALLEAGVDARNVARLFGKSYGFDMGEYEDKKKAREERDELRRETRGMKKGGAVKAPAKKFPDLTGDGKVTRADVLKGRGVYKKGGTVSKSVKKPAAKKR